MRLSFLGGALAALCLFACSSDPPPADDGADQSDQDLDSLDIANSWTDKANPKTPDEAGPIWWPWVMRLTDVKSTLSAVTPGRPREPVGIFSRSTSVAQTGSFELAPGMYGVLVQFKENGGSTNGALGNVSIQTPSNGTAVALGQLIVGTANPIGAGGWRRAYLRFEIKAGDDTVHYVHIANAAAGVEWQIGLVAVHREGRPFWAMAHNPDSIDRLRAGIAAGANAVEPDLRYAPDVGDAYDGNVGVTEEGLTGGDVDRDGQARLRDYLQELKRIAPTALVVWDTKKGGTSDYAGLGRNVVTVAQREGFDLSRSVFNISAAQMTGLYDPFRQMPKVGRCFDGIWTQVHSHTAEEWMGPVRANQLTFQGLGVTPQLQVTEKWSVPISVYVRAREQEEFPRKIYFWTVNDANAMRRVLDLGIDALITDEIPQLRSILNEQPYASMYRYATADDDPSVKHGGSWFHAGTR
jgi:hypothetical protein